MAGKNKKKKTKTEWFYMLPVGMMLVVVPLLEHAHVYTEAAEGYLYSGVGSTEQAIDFISYYKSVALLIGAAAMLLFFLYRKMMEEDWKISGLKAWIPLLVYAFFAFLSACFSDYKGYAFGGMEGTWESLWVLLAYALTAFYTCFMVDKKSILKKLLTLFKIGMSLLCIYGIIELMFGNPVGWDIAKYWLYTPNQLAIYGDNREISFAGLVLSFYNNNYVASLLALSIPVSLMVIFMEEKKGNKIWFGILFFLEWVMLIASSARSGLVAIVPSFLVLVILFRGRLLERRIWILAGVAAALAGYLLVEIPGGFSYSKRFAFLFTMEAEEADLKKIETLEDSVEITFGDSTLSLTYQGCESEKPFVAMCDGEEIVYAEKDGIWETEDSRFTPIQLAVTGTTQLDYFDVGIYGLGWRFINIKENGGYYYINPAHYIVKMETAQKAFSRKYWHLANDRGYIWAKTIPLLKKYAVLGSGPDTFYMVYPWNDYVDQASVMEKEIVYRRAHSMYLQMGIQTGGISLLAFLTFTGWYVAESVKLYGKKRKEKFSEMEILGIGIFVGVLGYLITGLVNDSMVGIAQFFWCFIGLGFAVNHLCRKEREKREASASETLKRKKA